MIRFSCPSCGKQHSARPAHAGRRGFCTCGTVMVVPDVGATRVFVETIGKIDLHADRRHAIYLTVAVVLAGIAIVASVVYFLHFHDTWERDNRRRLLDLKSDAETLVAARQYEEAKAKYGQFFGLLSDRTIKGDYLRDEVNAARIAGAENNRKLEPILAARDAAERTSPPSTSLNEYVNQQVEKNWRPMPGGNSKEMSKQVTNDVLNMKSFEEMDRYAREHPDR